MNGSKYRNPIPDSDDFAIAVGKEKKHTFATVTSPTTLINQLIGKHLDHLITKLTIAKTKISFSTIPLNQCKNDVPDVFSFEVEHSSFVDVTWIVVVRDVWASKHDFIKAIFNHFYTQISVISYF